MKIVSASALTINKTISSKIKDTNDIEIAVVDSCTSTSTILFDEVENGEHKNLLADSKIKVLITNHQSAGRGQRGREWIDNGQAILFSIAWHSPRINTLPAWSALAFGMSIAETLTYQKFRGVLLKWTNDLYWHNQNKLYKLGGILFERKKNLAVLGIGINVLPLADEHIKQISKGSFQTTPVSLSQINTRKRIINKNEIIAELILSVNNCFNKIQHSKDNDFEYRERWRLFDALFDKNGEGRKIKIHFHHHNFIGCYHGISSTGAIQININGEILEFYSGKVEIC